MIDNMSLNDQFRRIIDRNCDEAVSVQAALNYDEINDNVIEVTSEIPKQLANDGFQSKMTRKAKQSIVYPNMIEKDRDTNEKKVRQYG